VGYEWGYFRGCRTSAEIGPGPCGMVIPIVLVGCPWHGMTMTHITTVSDINGYYYRTLASYITYIKVISPYHIKMVTYRTTVEVISQLYC
jgi:hypothetical protein